MKEVRLENALLRKQFVAVWEFNGAIWSNTYCRYSSGWRIYNEGKDTFDCGYDHATLENILQRLRARLFVVE